MVLYTGSGGFMAVCVFSLLPMIVAQITIQLTAIAVVVPATPTAFQSLNLNPILFVCELG